MYNSVYITDVTALAIAFAMMLVFPEPEGPWITKAVEESLVKYELTWKKYNNMSKDIVLSS